ncbi:MAG: autotransporter domain-containing protein, partial [Desulfovibrio sp.]|nr:autotransporter domain-containing protein [Desulfovibrio sp.]
MRFLSMYLGLCKRAVAVAILFSSLVCNTLAAEPASMASQGRPAAIAPAASVFASALLRERAARADGAYTITGDANRTVTPGEYSQIIVNSPAASANSPDIIIGPGTVVLNGDAPLFNVPIASGNNSKVVLETQSDPAILRLAQGTATGTIGVGPYQTRASLMSANRDSLLYIGDGSQKQDLPTVTITGNINGIGRRAIESYAAESLLETQGANLVVKGSISNNQSSTMLRTLNAYNGSIETQTGGASETSTSGFYIYAYNVNLKPGNHVSAAGDFAASSVAIPGNAYIYAGNRLDVMEAIGGAGGSMAPDSRLESAKMVVLRAGLTKGAGLIKSDTRSILTHDTYADHNVETALFPIKQGGDDSLRLEAGEDILPGDTDVDVMRAGRDVIAGTLTFMRGDPSDPTGALPGRYFLNGGGEGFTYPRAAITANTIEVKGRLLAGELDMPRATEGKEASLTAGNIWITNSAPAENGFEQASGNLTLDNGSFTLTNPDNLEVQIGLEDTHIATATLDYSSLVDGDMTVTRNRDSTFTTLSVGGKAAISEGKLGGTLLKANAAEFSNLAETGISDTLDVATGLTITGNGDAKVTHTKVGGAASIGGGTYSGTDFEADSAVFTGVSRLNLTDRLTLETGLTMTDSVADSIGSAMVNNGDATVSGGSYAGGSLKANNATFTGVSGVTLNDSLNLSGDLRLESAGASNIASATIGGKAAISGGSYSGGTFSAASADFRDLDSLSLSGNFETTANATFENVKSANMADMAVGGRLSVASSYLTAKTATAASAVFANNASAEFDDLTLTGDDLSLVIDSGSTVFINNALTDLKGIEAIRDGKLIIHGYNDAAMTIAEIYIDKKTEVENENGIFNLTKGLYGGSDEGEPSSANFTQLTAGKVDITNADLTLAGIGNYANKVDGDLIIYKNGDSRLGDITVGGSVKIDGGTLEALKLSTGSASLSGAIQANISSLVITDKNGSLKIGASGEDRSTVSANSVDLNGAPLTVYGESALQINSGGENGGNLSAGAINIPESGTVSAFGDITADSAALGQKGAELAGANVTIARQLTEMRGAITATDGNVTLAGGAEGVAGSITANDSIVAGSAGNYADLSGDELALDAGANINAGAIAVSSLAAGANIDAKDITAKKLTAGGDVAVSAGSLNLTGEGSSIGGALTIKENRDSSLGNLEIGGPVSASGGSLAGGKVSAAAATLEGAIAANISELVLNGADSFLNIGKAGEAASSLVANTLSLAEGPLNVYGSSTVDVQGGSGAGDLSASSINIFQNGKVSASGAITTDSAQLGQSGAELSGASVSIGQALDMNGGAVRATDGDVALGGGAKGSGGSITASNDIVAGAPGNYQDLGGGLDLEAGKNIAAGVITANSLAAGANIDAKDITAKTLTAGGDVAVSAGSLNLTGDGSSIGGNLVAMSNVKSSLGSLEVAGQTRMANGELQAASLVTGSASFDNIRAAFDELVLSDASDDREFALTGTGANGSEATVGKLNLNGGSLSLAANSAAPANLFVGGFTAQADLINGNIAVSKNGLLVLGAQNANLLQTPIAIASSGLATFALAQPMRLDSRFGIHVTGAGAASPASGSIRFDAGSLFVIDSRMAKAVYAYLGTEDSIVPSAQLSESRGAIGALSADKASAPANVSMGAQIYIRNPQVNTVIVALGENITTLYADSTGRAGDSGAAPWTGANLDYDNKDQVKITRLENQYAGQFLVLPVTDPDTPDTPNPPQPDNPDTPDTPNPPQPDNPDTPDTPNPPQPDDPDTPDTPDNPEPGNPETPGNPGGSDTPEGPGLPDKPVPDSPSTPVTPHPGTTHPNAHPGIHNVIENGINKGHIGTEPHHLVTHHGAGFISHTLAHGNPHEATRLLESSSRMIILGAVPQMALSANDAAHKAISGRLGPENLAWQGDEMRARSFALWAVPIYRATNAWELEAGSHDYDYHGGLGGVAIGADVTWDDIVRAGLAFNIGGGYSKSGGQLAETANNMSFWGLGAYAGLAYGNFGVSADVGFTSTYNRVKQDVSALNNWQDLKTDATAWVLSAALELEYRLETGWLDVIPHAGFKYDYIHVDDYDITHRGNTIIRGQEFSQNIWTFPLGVKLAKEFNFGNGWQLRPELDFRVTPAAGDIEARTTTRYTGTDLDIELRTQTMDYITYGGSAG